MKILGYILISALMFMSAPISSELCSEEMGMQCSEMPSKISDSSKVAGADYCLCVFHQMQFSTNNRESEKLELTFSSIKFIPPQDNILSSLDANVLLQPLSIA